VVTLIDAEAPCPSLTSPQEFPPATPGGHRAFTSARDDAAMRRRVRDWLERAVTGMADAGALYGLPPGWMELAVLEDHERQELARQRAAACDGQDPWAA
jgi:hypothetical protein